MGHSEIDEEEMMQKVVTSLQGSIGLPLQLDSTSPEVLEKALRIYTGKAIINSVNGEEKSLNSVLPLAKKYGAAIVGLTLDEDGIPETVEKRVEIAEKIINRATEIGIPKEDIIIDCLTMTVSAKQSAAQTTLDAMKQVKERFGVKTTLGVSNVSFGLPQREVVNTAFVTLALENGLSAAIMNPYSQEMMKTYYSYNALKGLDSNCEKYVSVAESFLISSVQAENTATTNNSLKYDSPLQEAIIKGFKEKAAILTEELLKTTEALNIVNSDIIPALNIVGKGFEEKTVYLPQLLMSAEAAKSAFEVIKSFMSSGEKIEAKATFVLATVKGDIHDIGKNIVKLLLENYGYNVIDLGKDVPPEKVVNAVVENNAPICALSALMTTTVPAMEDTVKLVKLRAPWCKTVVGGAVLNLEYANKIGADKYASDAMETVRYAEKIIG